MRAIIATRGSRDVVYVDESGFELDSPCLYGWAPRGVRVYGERSGSRRPRQNLIAARRRGAFLAPLIISGTITAHLFERWLIEHLFRELRPQSTLVMDNAPFHRKERLRSLAQEHGHSILFLPPYSPDFNTIEHDFAALKKRWAYSPPGTVLDDIVATYQPA